MKLAVKSQSEQFVRKMIKLDKNIEKIQAKIVEAKLSKPDEDQKSNQYLDITIPSSGLSEITKCDESNNEKDKMI